MSGLVGFFRAFLPFQELMDNVVDESSSTNNPEGDDNGENGTQKDVAGTSSDNMTDPQTNMNDERVVPEYGLSLSSLKRTEVRQHDKMNLTDATTEPEEPAELDVVTPQEWRTQQTEAFMTFIQPRMVGAASEDEDDNDDDNNEQDDEPEEEDPWKDYSPPEPDTNDAVEKEDDYEVPENDEHVVPFFDTQPLPVQDDDSPSANNNMNDSHNEEQEESLLETQDFESASSHPLLPSQPLNPNTPQANHDNMEEEPTTTTMDGPMDPPLPLSSKRKRKSVPHISEASQKATILEEVDLYTGELNLRLCEIVKVWGLRKTRRMEWQDPAGWTNPSIHIRLNKHLPLAPYKSFEVDGPLSTIYKQVMSLELMELGTDDDHHSTTAMTQENDETILSDSMEQEKWVVREAAAAAFGTDDRSLRQHATTMKRRRRRRRRRVRVFFYGKYAEKMWELLTEYSAPNLHRSATGFPKAGHAKILASLQGIPAKCIFPFTHPRSGTPMGTLDPSIDYCICIGDKSQMRILSLDPDDENENDNNDDIEHQDASLAQKKKKKRPKQYFDSDVEVRFVRVPPAHINTAATATANATALYGGDEKKEQEEEPRETVVNEETVISEGEFVDVSTKSRLLQRYARLLRSKEFQAQLQQQQEQEAAAAVVMESVPRPHMSPSRPKRQSQTTIHAALPNNRTKRPRHEDRGYYKLSELRAYYDSMRVLQLDILSKRVPFQKIDDAVNVYGVVIGFTSPCITKQGDYMVSVTIVDQSLPLPPNNTDRTATDGDTSVAHITLVIFSKNRNKLPIFQSAGDVLRAHAVVVQEWSGDIQLCGKKRSAFTVVRPRNAEDEIERQKHQAEDAQDLFPLESWDVHLSENDEFGPRDYLKYGKLWHWGQRRLSSHPTMNVMHRFTVSQMGRQDHVDASVPMQHKSVAGDLTAMVASIIPLPEDERTNASPRGFLRMWDGTGPPMSDPLPAASLAARDAIRDGDPPSRALSSLASIVERIRAETAGNTSGKESNEITMIPPKSLCGRVINVTIWEKNHWDLITSSHGSVSIGKFIRLRNVNEECLSSGLRCLMLHAKSSLTPLPDRVFEVCALLEGHHARILRKEQYNPQSGVLPLLTGQSDADIDTTHTNTAESREEHGESASVSSLAQCLSTPAPASFVTRVCVMSTLPPFDPNNGLDTFCLEDGTFQFALHLKDDTAELDAIVSNEVAEILLGANASNRATHEKGVANLQNLLLPDSLWEGAITSTIFDGNKFFLLDSLTISQSTSACNI